MTTMRNSVQLIGNAGSDPEVKTLANDNKMARFSLATNEYYMNQKGERVEETQWHRVLAWGKTAEIIEKEVKKGRRMILNGKLVNNNWTDKEGNKHQSVEVQAMEVAFFS